MSNEIANLLFILIIFLPLCIQLSIDSLRYYAIKYNSSDDQLENFLKTLIPLFQIFYRRYIMNLTKLGKARRITPTEETLKFRRILTAVLPFLLIGAASIGFLKALIRNEMFYIDYPLHLLLMTPIFFFSWRFGHKLKTV